MRQQKTIAILYHETTPPRTFGDYRIALCAEYWTQWGFDVRYVQGPNADANVDLLINHVDLSVIPDEYVRLFDKANAVMNRNATDIRKSTFSKNLVTADSSYDGPVIVKTDCNYGGLPERQIERRLPFLKRLPLLGPRAARVLRQVARTRSLSRLAYTDALVPKDYPVYQSKNEVPTHIFANPDLVVEKYLPEFDGRYYYIRSHWFLGDGDVTTRLRSESQVVKAGNTSNLEIVQSDPSIVEARHALGFDYGKFDYMMHDGRAVLIDINKTPTYSRVLSSEIRRTINETLARGIRRWLPETV